MKGITDPRLLTRYRTGRCMFCYTVCERENSRTCASPVCKAKRQKILTELRA